jgi:hypothetical protein
VKSSRVGHRLQLGIIKMKAVMEMKVAGEAEAVAAVEQADEAIAVQVVEDIRKEAAAATEGDGRYCPSILSKSLSVLAYCLKMSNFFFRSTSKVHQHGVLGD